MELTTSIRKQSCNGGEGDGEDCYDGGDDGGDDGDDDDDDDDGDHGDHDCVSPPSQPLCIDLTPQSSSPLVGSL